uniref:39S ribosomal protein L46, mitochondrial n=1 Tax=Bursaphelenchus xylophilus TaxID=6326 RepID=A0A1I7RJ94_BURXY
MLLPLARTIGRRFASQALKEAPEAKWDISAAVALIRLPVIAPPLTEIEQKFSDQQRQIEDEGSHLSDFELRIRKDAELFEKRRQLEAQGKDLSELDEQIGIPATQEEEEYIKNEKKIRAEYELDNRKKWEDESGKSLRKALDRKLILLVKQKFSQNEPNFWTIPSLKNNGEPLRETAVRCLGDIFESDVNVNILGNAPVSVTQYEYSKKLADHLQTEGNHIFIYLAYINELDKEIQFNKDHVADYNWTSLPELKEFIHKRRYRKRLEHLLYE